MATQPPAQPPTQPPAPPAAPEIDYDRLAAAVAGVLDKRTPPPGSEQPLSRWDAEQLMERKVADALRSVAAKTPPTPPTPPANPEPPTPPTPWLRRILFGDS